MLFALQMANNLEGGKTPQLPPAELQRLGFQLVAYPLSLLGVSLQAMRGALAGIANGHAPPVSALPSFQASLAAADVLYKLHSMPAKDVSLLDQAKHSKMTTGVVTGDPGGSRLPEIFCSSRSLY